MKYLRNKETGNPATYKEYQTFYSPLFWAIENSDETPLKDGYYFDGDGNVNEIMEADGMD